MRRDGRSSDPAPRRRLRSRRIDIRSRYASHRRPEEFDDPPLLHPPRPGGGPVMDGAPGGAAGGRPWRCCWSPPSRPAGSTPSSAGAGCSSCRRCCWSRASSPVQALATNKLSSVFGTTTSAVTYARRVHPDLRTALPMAAVALVSSAAGASVASLLPAAVFKPVIVVALVGIGVFTLLRPALGDVTALRYTGRRHHGTALAIGAGHRLLRRHPRPRDRLLPRLRHGLAARLRLPERQRQGQDRQRRHQRRRAAGLRRRTGRSSGGWGC